KRGGDDTAELIGVEREGRAFKLRIAKLATRERVFAAGVFGARIIGVFPGQRGKLLALFCALENLLDLLPFLFLRFLAHLLARGRVSRRKENVRGAHRFRALELPAVLVLYR